MFSKILVANRGEIAIRAFRASYELGAKTVAVFPHEDRNSIHRQKADEAYLIGEEGHPVRAYLDVDEVVRVAKESGADAIYPGYGFLSENPRLARAAKEAGITFVGPPAEVLELAGNKVAALEAARKAGIAIKINAVAQKGVNDDEIVDFVNLTRDMRIDMRFIEFMPVSDWDNWRQKYIGIEEIQQRITEGVGELIPARLASPTIGGRDASISLMARSTEASSETSAPTPIALTARLEPISAAAALASSALMSRIAMDQPSRASRSAVARPMPRAEAAPVRTTVRSAGKVLVSVMDGS